MPRPEFRLRSLFIWVAAFALGLKLGSMISDEMLTRIRAREEALLIEDVFAGILGRTNAPLNSE